MVLGGRIPEEEEADVDAVHDLQLEVHLVYGLGFRV
jgi:hypothetical protein